MVEHEEKFSTRLTLRQTAVGKYEIHTMTAGVGNGWTIPADALKASLEKWSRVPSFVDHNWFGQSVRDLCGIITAPEWDDQAQGIKASFSPFGPAATVATMVAQDALDRPETADFIGFSADLYFTAEGKTVKEIMRVNSVDLVIEPARGGKFIRELQSKRKDMTETITPNPVEELARLQMEKQKMDEAAKAAEDQKKRQEAEAQLQALRLQMSTAVLQSTLAASNLPSPIQDAIREDFADKVFDPADLTKRIERDRATFSKLVAGQAVQGGRVSSMFNSDDMLTAAVQDMFGIERDEHLKGVKPARLSGIRELYHGLTGDFDLHGGVYPDRAMFQMTTANFPVIVKNAMNKILVNAWAEFGRAGYNWWEQLSTVQHFTNLNQITWSLFGTVGSLPTVAEGAEYTPLKIGDGGETSTFVKKGGYFGVTLEAIDRDNLNAIKAAPRELAFAGIREISGLVAALFTDSSGAGPTLADGGALFNSTAVTTAGGHANLLTTAIGTDYTAWEAVATAMYNQPMLVANETGYYGTGKKMAVEPKFCLVPRALRGSANNLFLSRDIPGATVALTSGKEWYGMVVPVTVPEWTDATDWAAVADPRLMPGIMIGERFGLMPEIFIAGNETDPAVFMNDESRIKVRHFIAVGVADFRPLHKENVAG